jgi:hypothetical protein
LPKIAICVIIPIRLQPYNNAKTIAMSKIIVEPGRSYKTKTGTVIKISEKNKNFFVGFVKDSGPDGDAMEFFETGEHILDPDLHLVEEVKNQTVFKKRNQS